MNKRFQIISIVEAEIIPDSSLELIKGGGTNGDCFGFTCTSYGYCKYFTCKQNHCVIFIDGECPGQFSCGLFGNQCRELQIDPNPCMIDTIE